MTSRTASLELMFPIAAQERIVDSIEYAQLAEELGYDHVWISETWGRDMVTILAAVAMGTNVIDFGTSIMPTYSRSPTLVGQTAATLQELSDCRFRLGLGPSGPKVIERWHGMRYEQPLRRTREYVEIVKQVVSGETVEYDGEIFSLSDFRLRFDPPAERPEVDVGAMGPKAVEMTGRFADGWHALMPTMSGFSDRLDDLHRGAKLGNREPSSLSTRLFTPACVLEDGDRARSLLRMHLAFYIGGMGPFYRNSIERQGYEGVATEVAESWQSGNIAAATSAIPDELIDSIGIAGSPPEGRKACRDIRNLEGVDGVSLLFPTRATKSEIRETITHLAPKSN